MKYWSKNWWNYSIAQYKNHYIGMLLLLNSTVGIFLLRYAVIPSVLVSVLFIDPFKFINFYYTSLFSFLIIALNGLLNVDSLKNIVPFLATPTHGVYPIYGSVSLRTHFIFCILLLLQHAVFINITDGFSLCSNVMSVVWLFY